MMNLFKTSTLVALTVAILSGCGASPRTRDMYITTTSTNPYPTVTTTTLADTGLGSCTITRTGGNSSLNVVPTGTSTEFTVRATGFTAYNFAISTLNGGSGDVAMSSTGLLTGKANLRFDYIGDQNVQATVYEKVTSGTPRSITCNLTVNVQSLNLQLDGATIGAPEGEIVLTPKFAASNVKYVSRIENLQGAALTGYGVTWDGTSIHITNPDKTENKELRVVVRVNDSTGKYLGFNVTKPIMFLKPLKCAIVGPAQVRYNQDNWYQVVAVDDSGAGTGEEITVVRPTSVVSAQVVEVSGNAIRMRFFDQFALNIQQIFSFYLAGKSRLSDTRTCNTDSFRILARP